MANVTAIVGAQWGDEGKGRLVDYLAVQADLVIRFQGGDNAGHTVINEKGKFALHIIPSGIFNEETMNIVGAGTVVNFETMAEELAALAEKGVNGRTSSSTCVPTSSCRTTAPSMGPRSAPRARRCRSAPLGAASGRATATARRAAASGRRPP